MAIFPRIRDGERTAVAKLVALCTVVETSMSLKHLPTAALAVASRGLATAAHAGKTLDAVKARGQVVCGVNTSGPGFSAADSQGKWSGLDVDFCRAVAAAV